MRTRRVDWPHMDSIDWLWNAPTSPPGLAEDQAQVWSFLLDESPARAGELAGLLTADERERAGKFGSEQLRNRFIVGRATLRRLLGRLLNCEPATLVFRYGEFGKPELDGPLAGALHFNLSHSGGAGLLAMARRGPLGIDLEKVRPVWDPQQIASRFFTEHEGRQLETVAEQERPEAFFRLWTRKEAWLKATGEGIAASLDRIEVSFLADEPARVLKVADDPGAADQWLLAGLAPARGFVGALAARARNLNIGCWHWSNGAK
jgi:4'-phosphopantetheinyl transferase